MQLGQQRSEAMRKFRQAHSPPLLFRRAGMVCLTTGSRRVPFNAAPVLCTITVWQGCSPSLAGWPRSHHHQETRRRRGSYLWLVKPLSTSPGQQGLDIHSTSSSGSPALTLLPAFMPHPDSQRSCVNTERGIRHCTERADLSNMV